MSVEDPRPSLQKAGLQRAAPRPGGRTLVTGSQDHTARVWDLSAPAAGAKVLRAHEQQIRCLAISPDGRTLVTGSGDSTGRVWDLRVDALRKLAPLLAGRELTADERARYGLAAALAETAQAGGVDVGVELLPWQVPRFPQPADAAWHQAQLRDCEARGLTFATQFHRQRLAHLRPAE
jgi:hypothetical protein